MSSDHRHSQNGWWTLRNGMWSTMCQSCGSDVCGEEASVEKEKGIGCRNCGAKLVLPPPVASPEVPHRASRGSSGALGSSYNERDGD